MNKLTNLLALISIVLFSGYVSSASANIFEEYETSIIVGAVSYHYNENDRKYLNQSHPSIGFEVNDFSVVYVPKNSWDNTSFYITYNPEFIETKYFDIGGTIGVATGYNEDEVMDLGNGNTYNGGTPTWMGLAPIIGVTVKAHVHDNIDVNLTATPLVAMLTTSYNF